MSYVIRILGTHQGPSPFDGLLLKRYDPNTPGRDSNGEVMFATIEATADPAQAMRFATPTEAIALYRMEASPRPGARIYNDGRPNRPLTAFTVVIEATP